MFAKLKSLNYHQINSKQFRDFSFLKRKKILQQFSVTILKLLDDVYIDNLSSLNSSCVKRLNRINYKFNLIVSKLVLHNYTHYKTLVFNLRCKAGRVLHRLFSK
jgi:hypothetical protein